jgi:hypothetical protein
MAMSALAVHNLLRPHLETKLLLQEESGESGQESGESGLLASEADTLNHWCSRPDECQQAEQMVHSTAAQSPAATGR